MAVGWGKVGTTGRRRRPTGHSNGPNAVCTLRFNNGENSVCNVFTLQTHCVHIVFTACADLWPFLMVFRRSRLNDIYSEDAGGSSYATLEDTAMDTIFRYESSFVNDPESTRTSTTLPPAAFVVDEVTVMTSSHTSYPLVSERTGHPPQPPRPPVCHHIREPHDLLH